MSVFFIASLDVVTVGILSEQADINMCVSHILVFVVFFIYLLRMVRSQCSRHMGVISVILNEKVYIHSQTEQLL
jgi:hypothetical protein